MAERLLSDPETWVDRHGDALYRFALLRLGKPDSAEEVVQETLLAALKGKEKFLGKSSERTWLIGILKNKVVDHLMRSAREMPIGLERDAVMDESFNILGRWRNSSANWEFDPAQVFDRKEFWKVFLDCLAGLPPHLARIFALRELDGLSTEKICKILDLRPTNAGVMLHRARIRLRACLDAKWFNRKGSS